MAAQCRHDLWRGFGDRDRHLAHHHRRPAEIEVLVGLAIGLVLLMTFVPFYLRVKPRQVKHWPLDVAAGLTIFVLHGQVLAIEPVLQRLAAFLGSSMAYARDIGGLRE